MISLHLRLGYKDFLRYELLGSMSILFILSKFLRYFSSLVKIFLIGDSLVRASLKHEDFDQVPQLEASKAKKTKTLLE